MTLTLGQPGPHSSSLSTAIYCFIAGAATASIIGYYCVVQPIQESKGDEANKKNDENHDSSWRRTISFSNVVEDISARIGELPQAARNRKIPWPWMDINRIKKEKKEAAAAALVEDENAKTQEDTTESIHSTDPSAEEKTDLCIGSIFGLDVGGTLAKLVYFEERPLSRYSNTVSPFSASAARSIRRSSANLCGLTHPQNPSSMSASQIPMDHDKNEKQHTSLLSQKSMSAREISGAGNLTATSGSKQMESQQKEPLLTSNDSSISPSCSKQMESQQEQPLPASNNSSISHDSSTEAIHHQHESQPHLTRADLRLTRSHDGVESSGENHKTDLQQEMPGRVRRIQSNMDFLTQREHRAQALDRFYAFARENLSNNPNVAEQKASNREQEPTDAESASPNTNEQEAAHQNPNNELVRDDNLSFDCLDGTFHFLHFETRYMQYATNLIRRYELHQTIHTLGATGGGAHKFGQVFQEELGITMKKVDELESLVAGMQFVLQTVVGECYTYRPPQEQLSSAHQNRKIRKRMSSSSLNNHYGNYVGVEQENWFSLDEEEEDAASSRENRSMGESDIQKDANDKSSSASASFKDAAESAAPKAGNRLDEWWWSRKVPRDAISDAATYPYLLVTIGTGVSILRVDGPRKHKRVSGSTIGGGTYWGLIRLLTSVENFSNVIELAEKGDPSKVDMMVGDIYGSNSEALEKLGLREDLVASSFGKLVAKEDPAEGLKEEDLARALLLMVTNNIGQVAYLNAQLHETSRIYFVGNFLRQNKLSQRRLSFAIDFWSKGKMEALFLEHEGYFGALGAFLMSQDLSSYPAQLQHFQQQQSTSRHRHSHNPLTPQQSMPVESSSCDEDDVDGENTDSSGQSSTIAAALAAFNRRSFTSLDGT